MPVSSPISDDVDPAPRILRLIASALTPEPALAEAVKRLRWTAEVLEGEVTMTVQEANTKHGRLLFRERRVKRCLRTTATKFKIDAKPPPRQQLSAEDERHRARAEELGMIEKEEVAGS